VTTHANDHTSSGVASVSAGSHGIEVAAALNNSVASADFKAGS